MAKNVSIGDVMMGDVLTAEELGTGEVVTIGDENSVRVDFDKAGLRWLTQASANSYGVKFFHAIRA